MIQPNHEPNRENSLVFFVFSVNLDICKYFHLFLRLYHKFHLLLLELLFVSIILKILHLLRFFLSSSIAFSNAFSCSGVIGIPYPQPLVHQPEILQYFHSLT